MNKYTITILLMTFCTITLCAQERRNVVYYEDIISENNLADDYKEISNEHVVDQNEVVNDNLSEKKINDTLNVVEVEVEAKAEVVANTETEVESKIEDKIENDRFSNAIEFVPPATASQKVKKTKRRYYSTDAAATTIEIIGGLIFGLLPMLH